MINNRIKAQMDLDTQQADQNLEKTKGKLSAFGNIKGPMIAAAAIAGLGVAGAAAAVKVSSAAADMQLSANKIKIVFGSQLPVIQQWSNEVAGGMGVSAFAVQGLAAGFQDLLIPMGFTRERATQLTTETIGLAAALAEWSGGQRTAAEVADILAKAMLGETESLKGLGISLKLTEIDSILAARGQKELEGNALNMAKALIAQELIFAKSTDAQAAYEKGSDSLARSQNQLKSAIANVKVEALDALIPAIITLNDALMNTLIPTIEDTILPYFRNDFPDAVQATIGALAKGIEWYDAWTEAGKRAANRKQARGDDGPQGFWGTLMPDFSDIGKGGMYGSQGPRAIMQQRERLAEMVAEESLNKIATAFETMNDEAGKLAQGIHDLGLPTTELTDATKAYVPTLIDHINATAAAMKQSEANKMAMDAALDAEILQYEAVTNLGRAGNYLVKEINEATAAEKRRADIIKEAAEAAADAAQEAADAAATAADQQRRAMEAMVASGRAQLERLGVTNAYFDSAGNLQMIEGPSSDPVQNLRDRTSGLMKHGMSFGGTAMETIMKDGKRTQTGREVSAYNLQFSADQMKELKDAKGNDIFVQVDAGIWTHDAQALGLAIAEAINTAASGSGAVLQKKTVAAQ